MPIQKKSGNLLKAPRISPGQIYRSITWSNALNESVAYVIMWDCLICSASNFCSLVAVTQQEPWHAIAASHDGTRCFSVSWVGCVHKAMTATNYGRKTLRKPLSNPWR